MCSFFEFINDKKRFIFPLIPLFRETIIQFFVFLFFPIDIISKWEIHDLSNKKIAILLPGYSETQFVFWKIRKQLRKNEIGYKVIKYKPFLGDLKILTRNLKIELDSILTSNPKSEIFIIGHSMGGLIGRYFLENYNYPNIHSLIMISTPHKGTILGQFGLGKCAKQLIPNSGFINDLSKSPICKTLNIYSTADSLICPRESAIYIENNIVLKDKLLHNSTMFNKETSRIIIEDIKYGKYKTSN
jgi:pimeloyl-ACP methyl ester carboxylesterase